MPFVKCPLFYNLLRTQAEVNEKKTLLNENYRSKLKIKEDIQPTKKWKQKGSRINEFFIFITCLLLLRLYIRCD